MARKAAVRVCALLAASALAAFAACELLVRWHVEGGLGAALASVVDGPSRGGALGRAGAAGDFLPDDELGYRLNPESEGINSRGFRGPEVEPEAAPGTTRVILLGDSVAYGDGGFPDLLRARLAASFGRPVELVNASVPGYTAHQERSFYERALEGVRADLVLLQYCANDNHEFLYRVDADGRRLTTPEAKRALLPEGADPWSRFGRWSYAVVEVRRRLWMRELASSSRFPWDAREDFAPAWREASWAAYERELTELGRAVRARGARLGLVAFPLESQLDAKLLAADREYVLRPGRQLARICAAAAVPMVDLFEAFSAVRDGDAALFSDGIHLSAAGHELAARELEAFVTRSGLLAPPAPTGS